MDVAAIRRDFVAHDTLCAGQKQADTVGGHKSVRLGCFAPKHMLPPLYIFAVKVLQLTRELLFSVRFT
jgi:hypothetical protein